MNKLSTKNHDRDIVGLTYVYPVISRRAGGVSLGINLNPNNKCNWQCVYCQVPNLQRGVAPEIDLTLLTAELDGFLGELLHGSYMEKHVPKQCQTLCDLAISGNGEPTTCPNFEQVVSVIVGLMGKYDLSIPLRLITNGSSVHRQPVTSALALIKERQGEVWFKVDAIGELMTQQINGVSLSASWQLKQLQFAASTCPTWLQTCVLKQETEDETFTEQYLTWLKTALSQGIKIEGVLLYGLALPSLQEGGELLVSADDVWLKNFAQKIESCGIMAKVS